MNIEHLIPEELFDGHAVMRALTDKARARTSAENVSDVLDAAVKIIRERLHAVHGSPGQTTAATALAESSHPASAPGSPKP